MPRSGELYLHYMWKVGDYRRQDFLNTGNRAYAQTSGTSTWLHNSRKFTGQVMALGLIPPA